MAVLAVETAPRGEPRKRGRGYPARAGAEVGREPMTTSASMPPITVEDVPRGQHVVCRDLFKIYKIADLEVVALRGLDLSVGAGEVLAIVGASGSGKSSLLNVLAGLDVPSAGTAFVNGRDLLQMSEADMVRYRREEVGFVWQQTSRNLIPYLSSQQNIEVPMILSGRSRKAARERALELLEAVGLTEKRRQRPDQLSGGEQQRVSIGVALANDPPLLLADEPTGELDTHTSEEIFELFRRLSQQFGLTIVIVTHDPAIAARVDRVVAIRDGSIATETVRRIENAGTELSEVVHEEFAVVDSAGRLQIPKPLAGAVDLGSRAKVDERDGRIVITPVRSADGPPPR